MYTSLNVKYLLLFQRLLNFLDRYSKTNSKEFNKTSPLEEELFHADTQTDEKTDKHNDASSLFFPNLLLDFDKT